MRITAERKKGMFWEIAGIIEMLRARAANKTIEPTEITAPKFSLVGRKERMLLQFRISPRLSCSRSTPATIAPPKKKNGT